MKKKAWNKYINLLMQLALSMMASILSFLFLGLFLDRYFNFQGVLVIAFVFFGVVFGFYLVYLKLKSFF